MPLWKRIMMGGCFGAVGLGFVAFAAGFFGPIIFTPDANQGPLLGIFVTGPLGAVAGALIGALVGGLTGRRRQQPPSSTPEISR